MRIITAVISLVLLCAIATPISWACGFADLAGNIVTIRMDAAESKLLLYGTLKNRQGQPNVPGQGSTDFAIVHAFKTDPLLAGRKDVKIDRRLPDNLPNHVLLFGNLAQGQPAFSRGVYGGPALADYVRGLLAIDSKNREAVLRYCFDYLDDKEAVIAEDAYAEFITAPDDVIGRAARTFPPEKLRKWLNAEKTPDGRLRLYGFLLGNCGTDKDADLLRELVVREKDQWVDGVLSGYVLLQPKEGWELVQKLAKDANGAFQLRWSAFRTVRFFHATRPDVVSEKDLLVVLDALLDQQDFADLPIETLRDWRCWKLTDRVLSLYDKESHQVPLIRRAILRYALQCPDPSAAKFIGVQRQRDRELVEEIEECLRFEKAIPGQGR